VVTPPSNKLPRIQCDRVQVQQVMLNLIVNAIQSMSGVEDGNRELQMSTVSIEPEGVCVAVRDTGHGLRPESLPRLFEPFYTTKPDCMGMGLSICRSIIEAHGGRPTDMSDLQPPRYISTLPTAAPYTNRLCAAWCQ
jgi:signal transduction histidine kinase